VFIAMSTFTIANGMTGVVKQAFIDRPHLVDAVPGFVRMEVLSPLDRPDEVWLLTYWRDAESFHDWHRGHLFKDAHRDIPTGLKLVPRSAQLRFFTHVCD